MTRRRTGCGGYKTRCALSRMSHARSEIDTGTRVEVASLGEFSHKQTFSIAKHAHDEVYIKAVAEV